MLRENFFEEEIICGYTITPEMKRLWAVELDLLETLMAVCDKYALRHYAIFGTLLGAVRHKGFIPWDDDIDIAMPRADIEKLKEVAASEFKYPYFLQTPESDPGFFGGILRLRNSGTTHANKWDIRRSYNKGCYIDILALDSVSDNPVTRIIQRRKVDLYKRRLFAAAVFNDVYPEYIPKRIRRAMTGMCYTHTQLCGMYHAACTQYDNENARKYGILSSDRICILDKDIFDSAIMMDFEHLKIPVPVGYKKFIRKIWGGQELPKERERLPKHVGIIDTLTSYVVYEKPYIGLFNNIEGKQILIFGAGHMFTVYMEKHGKKYPPAFVFDNNPSKWGSFICGVLVKNPIELPQLLRDNGHIIIVNIYHNEIVRQLEDMGITEYYIYTEGRRYGEEV